MHTNQADSCGQSLRNELAEARHEACCVVHVGQDQEPIHYWRSLFNQIRDPEIRREEAQLAFDASYEGRPFRGVADICLTTAEQDMKRLQPTGCHI